MIDRTIRRPALRYYGGNWRLAPWLLRHLTRHRCYCEPFAGGASVLLRKERAAAEVINDLDGDVVRLFRFMRDRPQELIRAIELTPCARAEFELARCRDTDDELELARRYYVRCWQAMHAGNRPNRTGWRHCRGTSRNTSAAHEFAQVEHLWQIADRLRGVQIEHDQAQRVIARYDSPETAFLVDPPYLRSVRSRRWGRDGYAHEMADSDHEGLLACLQALVGMVLLQGYRSDLYDQALLPRGWQRWERPVITFAGTKAMEALYTNPAAQEALAAERGRLFERADQPLEAAG
ncbi:MAG TPA: DNA adenine methylase [Thermoanaerobaculia bacterium]|nr:DNA adenine methylase [Thermoanaerobaculia bacterium]